MTKHLRYAMLLLTVAWGSSFLPVNAAPVEERMRPVKLVNGDLSVPSENDIVGWGIQNNSYPGSCAVERDVQDAVNVLKITPYPTKLKAGREVRTLVVNMTQFKARVGDRVRVSFEFCSQEGGKVGCILWNGKANQWVIWSRPCSNSWQTFTGEYILKQAPAQAVDNRELKNYQLGFDVFNAPVKVRNIRIWVQKKGLANED